MLSLNRKQTVEIMEETSTLQEIAAFLGDPASYPHAPEAVEIIQTHASYVALAPPFVFKLKKPVSLGFLDFSTLEKRRHFCQEEVRLNRRLCRSTYIGVVEIKRSTEGLAFGGEGVTVDYVVKMHQLPADYFLDELLKRNAVTRDDIDSIVDVLASFYTGQEPDESISEWGRIDHLKVSTDENFEQSADFSETILPEPGLRAVQYYTDRFYTHHAALFDRRVAEGRILDCHGDLHLEHIHLSPDGICIYDCIEFNERFRSIDVASDVAFLAMDFEHKGYAGFARYLCERMAQVLKDPEMALLLPFYKCYRAFVRGKVAAMKHMEEEVDASDRRLAGEEARSYFQLALRYALGIKKPLVIVLMGRPASGKSTQARLLAEMTGWPLFASDVIRKQLAGVPLYERGSIEERGQLYSSEHTKTTYTTLLDRVRQQVNQGNNVVVEATFSRRQERARWSQAFEGNIVFIEVFASDETLKSRLAGRNSSTEEVSDARFEDFEMLNSHFEAPEADESVVAVSSERSPAETAFEVMVHLID